MEKAKLFSRCSSSSTKELKTNYKPLKIVPVICDLTEA
jgi:hypothetical protein